MPISNRTVDAAVIVSAHEEDLVSILRPEVQAVIVDAGAAAPWRAELTTAIESGQFCVPRTLAPCASRSELAALLEQFLPRGVVTEATRVALMDDILGLIDRLARLTGAKRFRLRLFTEAPTTECGFHVDTTPPAAPDVGLLRVYNGAGTLYVDPANLTGLHDFHRYVSRRERLARERREAWHDDRIADAARLDREIVDHDEARPFLRRPDQVAVAPAGSIVAFRHVDVRHHWSDSAEGAAWIHCSPTEGPRRLVVNVTAPEPARTPRRTATAAHPA